MSQRKTLLSLIVVLVTALFLSLDVGVMARGGGGGGGGRGGGGGDRRGGGSDRPNRRDRQERAKKADRALDENCEDQSDETRKRCRRHARKRMIDRLIREAREDANCRSATDRDE